MIAGMPASLRQLRREVTGRVRYRGTQLFTGLRADRRLALAQGARSHAVSRALLPRAAEWYARAPVGIAGGLPAGLVLSTAHLALDHAHAGLLVRGTLEPSVQEALRRTVRPGHVVYDVGANIGFFTLAGARLVGPQGRVIAFEPVPWCAAAVARNIELNDLAHAEIREEAVGAQAGRARLLVVEEASWSHLDSTGRRHPDAREDLDVAVATIDALVAGGELPAPDVLKIDTEGAELQVVEGMRETLERHRPTLICELHDTNERFAALMDELGYRTTNLDGPWPVAESPTGIHALAQPRD